MISLGEKVMELERVKQRLLSIDYMSSASYTRWLGYKDELKQRFSVYVLMKEKEVDVAEEALNATVAYPQGSIWEELVSELLYEESVNRI